MLGERSIYHGAFCQTHAKIVLDRVRIDERNKMDEQKDSEAKEPQEYLNSEDTPETDLSQETIQSLSPPLEQRTMPSIMVWAEVLLDCTEEVRSHALCERRPEATAWAMLAEFAAGQISRHARQPESDGT